MHSALAILALTQMPWTSHLPQHGVALDFLRPKFDGAETSLSSAAIYFSGRVRSGNDFFVRFEMPFAHYSESGESSSALGNPYVGIEMVQGAFDVDAGFRPSVAPDDQVASVIGLSSDATRFEAFLPHLATFSSRITYRKRNTGGATFEIGGGPSIWIPTENGDIEFILHHFGSIGYQGSKAWFAFGIGGMLNLTGDGSFGDRSIYQLGASAGLTQGSFRPALHLILPVDDVYDNVEFVLGLGAAIPIK